MSLPIFWRLVFSHLGILLLSGAACWYSIVQLGSLSGSAHSALDHDHRMIDYQEALTEAFLSQVRYGGKYLITRVEGRHEQMQQFKNDFNKYLELLKSLGQSEQITTSVTKIDRFHQQYHELFDREVEYIRTKQNYAQSRFRQERDKIVQSAIDDLDDLQAHLRTTLQEKLESIEYGARASRRIAILTTLVVLILGTLLSLKVSKDLAALPREMTGGPSPKHVVPRHGLVDFVLSSVQGSMNSINSLKRLPLTTLNFGATWNRCSAIFKNPIARKGG
jgi:CHASE3 domain sensor protein